jgi:hypothetical protein
MAEPSYEDEALKDFEHYKFAREIISKEIEFRREKQWKIFSWTNSILVGIIGGLLAISGKGFALSKPQKALLVSAVIILTTYAWVWISQNWKKENEAKGKAVTYDSQFKLRILKFNPNRKVTLGYIGTIVLLALAAILTTLLVETPPANSERRLTTHSTRA